MKLQNRIMYIPPLVLDQVELETENPILAGSGEPPTLGTVSTEGQPYNIMNLEDDTLYYNGHDWD